MLAVISPAKSLSDDAPHREESFTTAVLLAEASQLVSILKTKSPAELAALMKISDELAALNAQRYADWELPFEPANARRAGRLFAGDVYQGLDTASFDAADWQRSSEQLRILSGLYGVLRPTDLIQPYRLEMGTRLASERGSSLYEWWGDLITTSLRAEIELSPGEAVVVNVASQEYFKAVRFDLLGCSVITPRFEDQNPAGQYKVISFHAKRARGWYARWMIKNQIERISDLIDFDLGGYRYCPKGSTKDAPLFRRSRTN